MCLAKHEGDCQRHWSTTAVTCTRPKTGNPTNGGGYSGNRKKENMKTRRYEKEGKRGGGAGGGPRNFEASATIQMAKMSYFEQTVAIVGRLIQWIYGSWRHLSLCQHGNTFTWHTIPQDSVIKCQRTRCGFRKYLNVSIWKRQCITRKFLKKMCLAEHEGDCQRHWSTIAATRSRPKRGNRRPLGVSWLRRSRH